MKTLAQIDVINVTERNAVLGKVYTAEYWDENFDGEHNCKMEISHEALLNHVANEYPSVEYLVTDISDEQFLAENRDEIIKDFIQANS